jgi:hypothetical protein
MNSDLADPDAMSQACLTSYPTPTRPPRYGRTDTGRVTVEPSVTATAARTGSRDIRRHKASNYPGDG